MADEELRATREPATDGSDVRYVLLRTKLDPYGQYDARFANYEIELLPPNTDRDSALESALVAADENAVWLVFTGEIRFIESTEGLAKIRVDKAAKKLAEAAARKVAK